MKKTRVISKKDFVDILNFIDAKNKQQDKLSEVLEEMSPGCYCETIVYSEYEDKILKLLETMFDDKYQDIEFFLYDSCWLFRDKGFSVDFPRDVKTDKFLYDSPETLYDYLTRQNKK